MQEYDIIFREFSRKKEMEILTEIVPAYYEDFQCIASACRHCCCIGWEIDIDEDTAAYYAALPGELGARLRENIVPGEPDCFRLTAEERCPFLNRDNLCELILTLGEDSLCEICTEHPRFHNQYGDREESGLGLCCEAAAALILGQREPFSLKCFGDAPKDADYLLRERVFAALTDHSLPLPVRFQSAAKLCGGRIAQRSPAEWLSRFLALEQMEPAWTELLHLLEQNLDRIDFAAFSAAAAAWETEYELLACYFVFRHFLNFAAEYGAAAALGFALLGCGLIYALHALRFQLDAALSFDARAEIARLFSAEIEYSDENPALLLEALSAD